MNEVKIPGNEKCKDMLITTNHAASSYGKPVLVDDRGNAYGPLDMIGEQFDIEPNPLLSWLEEPAERAVASRAKKAGLEDHPLIRKFYSF